MPRKPYAAGYFYESEKEKLLRQIESCFLSAKSPENNKRILGVIVPHAGYIYSGKCAAQAYKKLSESEYEIFIVIGFSHKGLPSSISSEDWETPLGTMKTDSETAKKISGKTQIPINNEFHMHEHSIEVQIPFIQYITQNNKSPSKIICINISDGITHKKAAPEILTAVKSMKKTFCIIASSDFTHFGPNYGFIPFQKNLKENLQNLDMGAIKNILNLDGKGFNDYTEKTGATICGRNPISLILEIASLEKSKPKLLDYCTSGDITKDFTNSVSYASIIFEIQQGFSL